MALRSSGDRFGIVFATTGLVLIATFGLFLWASARFQQPAVRERHSDKAAHIESLLKAQAELKAAWRSDDIRMPDGKSTLTAAYLVSMYTTNELEADSMFKGKRLMVLGRVEKVGRDLLGTPYIILRAGSGEFRTVQAFFPKSEEQTLIHLPTNYPIYILGDCKGLMMNVLLENARVIG